MGIFHTTGGVHSLLRVAVWVGVVRIQHMKPIVAYRASNQGFLQAKRGVLAMLFPLPSLCPLYITIVHCSEDTVNISYHMCHVGLF